MTSPAPITDAIPIVRRSVYTALSPLMSGYTAVHSDGTTRAKLYWMQADQVGQDGESIPLPFVVYQPQDGGGVDAGRIGGAVWEGLVTIRAIASRLNEAETLLGVVQAGMGALAVPFGYNGYDIKAHHERPLTLPPADGVWQAGSIYRVTLARI